MGNPYCASYVSIDYQVSQHLFQNGGHYIEGDHDRMPNHQLYRVDRYSDTDEYSLLASTTNWRTRSA